MNDEVSKRARGGKRGITICNVGSARKEVEGGGGEKRGDLSKNVEYIVCERCR